jgi:hypothetical protein
LPEDQAGDQSADPSVGLAGPPPACAAQTRASGWVAAENARPGTPVLARTTGPAVLGYLSASSAVCGQQVAVHLSGPAQTIRLLAYRLGSYHGVGARFVWQSGDVPVRTQRIPPATATGLVEPNWTVSYTLTVTPDFVPGMYELLPVAISGRGAVGPPIPLVVRDDPGREPLLVMASTLTWNAYSDFGGRSLYFGPGATKAQQLAARARVVAVHRPLTGSGLRQWEGMDQPVARWVESLGLDVAYTTDVALDARPSQVLQHAGLVVGGHSEYWTRRLYDAVEAALGRGVNVAMLGANNAWWQARVEDGGTHEVVYRVLADDPDATVDPSAVSILWNRAPLNRPWAAVSGQSHAGVGVRGGLQLVQPPSWLVAGSSLGNGALLPGAVGNEADGFHPAVVRPASIQVLAVGVLTGSHGPVTVSTNYVTIGDDAVLFTAGTTMWACALDPGCSSSAAPAPTRTALRTLTRNLLVALAEPRAGLRYPATATVVGSPKTLVSTLPREAHGTYGGESE